MNGSDPAFPKSCVDCDGGQPGMDIRTWLAGRVMQSLIAVGYTSDVLTRLCTTPVGANAVCNMAWDWADRMIATQEREKEETDGDIVQDTEAERDAK